MGIRKEPRKETSNIISVPILPEDVATLSELDIDDLPEIKKIRHFVDQKINEVVAKTSVPDGSGISDIEELAIIFFDSHSRYSQAAKIAPELYTDFAEKSNKLDSLYGSYDAEAKKANGEFNSALTDYENAVRRMKSAYRNLNNCEHAFAFDEAILEFAPKIEERRYLSGTHSEYWGEC